MSSHVHLSVELGLQLHITKAPARWILCVESRATYNLMLKEVYDLLSSQAVGRIEEISIILSDADEFTCHTCRDLEGMDILQALMG